MTTASLGPGRAATDMPLPSTAAIRLGPLAAVLVAAALWLLPRSGTLGPIIGEDASGIVELSAKIALWLGMAWLIKRLFSLAVLHYSGQRRRAAGLRAFEGGAKLLVDLFGVVLFLGALFGTMTARPSIVSRPTARQLASVILPAIPDANSIQSPIAKGRST